MTSIAYLNKSYKRLHLLRSFRHLGSPLCSLRLGACILGCFAPSAFVLRIHILGRFTPSGFVLRTRINARTLRSPVLLCYAAPTSYIKKGSPEPGIEPARRITAPLGFVLRTCINARTLRSLVLLCDAAPTSYIKKGSPKLNLHAKSSSDLKTIASTTWPRGNDQD